MNLQAATWWQHLAHVISARSLPACLTLRSVRFDLVVTLLARKKRNSRLFFFLNGYSEFYFFFILNGKTFNTPILILNIYITDFVFL